MYLIPEPISCAKEKTFESHLLTPITNAGLVMSAHENPIKSTAAEVHSETLKNDKLADKTVSISRPAQTSPHSQHQAPSSQQQNYHQQPQAPKKQYVRKITLKKPAKNDQSQPISTEEMVSYFFSQFYSQQY